MYCETFPFCFYFEKCFNIFDYLKNLELLQINDSLLNNNIQKFILLFQFKITDAATVTPIREEIHIDIYQWKKRYSLKLNQQTILKVNCNVLTS